MTLLVKNDIMRQNSKQLKKMILNYSLPNTLTSASLNLGNFMNKLVDAALDLNRTNAETKADYETSRRTGQCHIVWGNEDWRAGIQFIPTSETEKKVRYQIVANNKFTYLLANPEQGTTPLQPENLIFPGGVRYLKEIAAVSGFHPKIDEAMAVILLCHFNGQNCLHWMKSHKNDFVLVLYNAVKMYFE